MILVKKEFVKHGWRYCTENLYKRDDNMTTTKECEEEATVLEEEVRQA